MIYVVLIVASFLTEGAQATHQVRAPIGNPLGMYIFFFPLWCSVRLIVKCHFNSLSKCLTIINSYDFLPLSSSAYQLCLDYFFLVIQRTY